MMKYIINRLTIILPLFFVCFYFLLGGNSFAQSNDFTYHWENVNGLKIFYRAAGNPSKPTIVLLHGVPSSSVMYQGVMELLKNDFYLVAPDYPAHGYSDVPPASYPFTFENISNTIYTLLNQLGIHHYSLYMQDYGAPVGFRLAVKHPEQIDALIVQNGNAYIEGFPDAQDPNGDLERYWRDKNKKYENNWIDSYRKESLVLPSQRNLGTGINPDRRNMDAEIMLKPGRLDLFMQLWFDYGNNVKSYPQWHEYLKKYQPPVLIAWGKEDNYFTVPGALAFLKDVPRAEIHLLNGGHWAVAENNTAEIAELIESFFRRSVIKP
ncbi:alpha/beta fold hydrolase [Mucilaginibacter lappiensis]|uniref:Pimeloyl-ACP methyl ester carboxylesterase n=1 Tax=Mucilaginibacter lappiensis TaxID=354630 RepID=A0A841JIQ7_9SPHI|nr:alpha/beta hydrolase [Mucilaginibacter lappiensis]MBB6129486.1 pimeloyl-ACP methyl ester carboxylesterase [Mucilaginibacter lappiensis]